MSNNFDLQNGLMSEYNEGFAVYLTFLHFRESDLELVGLIVLDEVYRQMCPI